MSEVKFAENVAGIVLDRPYADPDSDLSVLARQFLRAREEIARHVQHKAEAGQAAREALSLCQHSPEEWMAMSAELREFKLKIFSTLEMRCLNLGSEPKQRSSASAEPR
jgi:hypothetical protein